MKTNTTNTNSTGTTSSGSRPSILKNCIVTTGLICFTAFQLYAFNNAKSLHDEHYNYINNIQGGNSASSSFKLESFVISMDSAKVEQLKERNKNVNLGKIQWTKGTNGMKQQTLDYWTQLTNHGHAPMTVEEASKLPKNSYQSPHAVGCYLSHFNLLRSLAHRPVLLPQQQQSENNNKQHAFLILEDDATCAPGLKEEIERTIQQLPIDWDILYVSGKPFSYFEHVNEANNHQHGIQLLKEYKQHEASSNWTAQDMTNGLIRKAICHGDYGKAGGPLAPDGTRRLSQENQPYWRVHYFTNTDSYVVNPNRVQHLTKLLHPTDDVPIDIRLTDLIKSNEINAYMTTRMWCDQRLKNQQLQEPQTWQGFFVFISGENKNYDYTWQTQMHLDDEDCAY